MSKGIGTLFTGLAVFAGGIVTGMLLTPKSGKENRKWLQEHSEEAKHWIEDRSNRILEDSEKRIGQVSKNIQKSVKENLPDLYEATEALQFEDDELEGNV